MPNFVLNRNAVLDGRGHKIRFEKGQPTWVPPELVREAIGIGGECVDEIEDPFKDEGGEGKPQLTLTEADKQKLFFEAFDDLIAANISTDFGGDGKPSMEALKKKLNFAFTKKERDNAILAYREMKAKQAEE